MVRNKEVYKVEINSYNFPDYNLLERENAKDNTEYVYKEQKIEQFFKSFNIFVKCKDILLGVNSVTYVIQLSPGTKLSTIKRYKQDLMMNFNAIDVEFEISINGTEYLGVVLIKERKKILKLGDIINSVEVKENRYKIPIILGKDLNGKVCVENLAELPHLLIAGTTGTGKSTFLSSIIINILYNFSPEDIKLILIDTRETSFLRFNKIPHLYIPVVTDSEKTVCVLEFLINEMQTRYRLFKSIKVDNIDKYNEVAEEKFPRIVIIIEDWYDLMLNTKREVENYIKTLSQMSRAAGIHIVISTQRPSTNVITGIIKANMPARISFYVPSYIDSKTIIEDGGAEKLQNNGDIIFKKVGIQKNKRIQTPYITDNEIKRIVESFNYNSDIFEGEEKFKIYEDFSSDENAIDPLLMDAIEYAIEEKQITASMLQRKFKIGYSRAGKIIDQMEVDGIISGYEGSKPRKVLIENENIGTKRNEPNVEDAQIDQINEIKEEESIFCKWWFWLFAIIFGLIIIGNM